MENNKNVKNKNYDLKSEAVENLVNADSGDVPEYSQEELEKFRSRRGIRVPDIVKILLIKAWFAGAVCYFFLWGLGTYISGLIDMLFILGVALGMVTDLLTNNVIRFIEKTPGENHRLLMVTQKGVVGFFLNIVYSMLVLICVYMLYNLINYTIVGITGAAGTVPLGVEPVLFGIFCMGFDMLFIGFKGLLRTVIRDAQNTVDAENKGE